MFVELLFFPLKTGEDQIKSIYFHDEKAQGKAAKDQMVTSIYCIQMQQLTIYEQKDRSKNKNKERNKIIIK